MNTYARKSHTQTMYDAVVSIGDCRDLLAQWLFKAGKAVLDTTSARVSDRHPPEN